MQTFPKQNLLKDAEHLEKSEIQNKVLKRRSIWQSTNLDLKEASRNISNKPFRYPFQDRKN